MNQQPDPDPAAQTNIMRDPAQHSLTSAKDLEKLL
jgi:hypothetical protein